MTEQTQPTDAELMPCPFCGEAAKHSFNDFYGDMSMACCKSCGAQAYAPKWNRRAVLAKWGTPAGAAPVMKERFSEPLARVINAGYLLANCAFNLAQRPGTEISIGTAKTLSDCRKEWDAACAAHKALPPAPQPTQAQAGFKSGAKSFQTNAEANAYSKGYYAGKKAATKAQAGAVPLTVDEVEQLIAQWSYEVHGDRARYLVRMTEQHHGIKGADHA